MTYPWAAGEVLTAADLNAYAGLVLVKTQTIGTAVSSVTVTDAFSSTFDNYRVIVDIGDATNNGALQFTSPQETGSVYDWALGYLSYVATPSWVNSGLAGTTYVRLGFYTSDGTGEASGAFVFDILRPNQPLHTYIHSRSTSYLLSFAGGRVYSTAQLTDLRLTLSTGTITGGTIRVYGYNDG